MTSDESNAAKDIADRVGEQAKSATGAAESAASKAGGAAREFAARAGNASADLYARTQDRVHEVLDGLPDQAADALQSGRRTYEKSSDAVAQRVKKQPLEALLLAGAIGYLVGWAANRG